MDFNKPDIIKQLGPLAIVSRLRRLTERMAQDAGNIMKEQNLAYELRWFPVFYTLSVNPPTALCDIAKQTGMTHSAINQIANDMLKHDMLIEIKDERDKRKRYLTLSPKALELLPQLQTIWQDVETVVRDMLSSTGYDVLHVIDKLEEALDQKTMYARFYEMEKFRQMNAVEILEYTPDLLPYFESLNREWIETYFEVEPADEACFADPEAYYVKPGGEIFFARCYGDILGTCALKKMTEDTYELSKMGVTEKARGKQIGKKLMEAAIDKAKRLGAKMLYLETNSKLIPAVTLYRSVGFVEVPFMKTQTYEQADKAMALNLVPTHSDYQRGNLAMSLALA